MSKSEIFAKGVNGQVELYDNKICIRRKGVLSFLTQGIKGDKNIMISSISSIQIKNAGVMFNGYIQFAFAGGKEAKGGIFQGTHDENTVMFTKGQQPVFEKIRDIIEERYNPESTSSNADELEKLASLRDKKILTEEEFQQKKKQILEL